jgi:hypothetical protein
MKSRGARRTSAPNVHANVNLTYVCGRTPFDSGAGPSPFFLVFCVFFSSLFLAGIVTRTRRIEVGIRHVGRITRQAQRYHKFSSNSIHFSRGRRLERDARRDGRDHTDI